MHRGADPSVSGVAGVSEDLLRRYQAVGSDADA